ncbi:hypothetical protein F383_04117 [Gossypium arboreum]|uniref:Uncharacterized protein n=1 Tax=Gossypium arboreum TaxID=29729 RepID=A0A0B0P531_GOSAR|nr:hypothetical protein F383_04117 [Gossypium arboreum]
MDNRSTDDNLLIPRSIIIDKNATPGNSSPSTFEY